MSSIQPPKIANVEVKELFPTPLWIVDLAPEEHVPLNAALNAEIERLLTPRPAIPQGANWQTDQTLHTLPQFARLVELMQAAGKGAMRWMGLENLSLVVTGCWANINPPGAFHPRHTHPNNLLSGVYYSKAGPGAAEIVVSDPRPQAHVLMPQPKTFTLRTANSAGIPVKDGRIVMFPSWLHHHVMPNHTESERISIAFNLMIPQYTETLAAPMWKGNVAVKP
jgi:uncharacterized protein (TIGR02466 family)